MSSVTPTVTTLTNGHPSPLDILLYFLLETCLDEFGEEEEVCLGWV